MAMSQRVLPESEPSAQDNPSSAYSGSTAGVSSLPTSPTSRCPPDQTTSTQYNERVIGNQPSASADFVSSSGLPLGYDLASVLDFMYSQQSAFQRAADNLLKTTGVLLRVYSPEQQKDILRNVYRGRERPLSKVAACELCALAAVGTQFSGGEIPSEGADVLYSIARHFLDDVISSSPLRAVKVVALFSMFNIVNHATVALAYIGEFCYLLSCSGRLPGFTASLMLTLLMSRSRLELGLPRVIARTTTTGKLGPSAVDRLQEGVENIGYS